MKITMKSNKHINSPYSRGVDKLSGGYLKSGMTGGVRFHPLPRPLAICHHRRPHFN
jgi:hypothetical protein